jgi:CRISPR-associated endoribonuclease Cas6
MKGLLQEQSLEIADKRSAVNFRIEQVESIPYLPASIAVDNPMTLLLNPISPIIAGRKNERGYYDYRSPYDPNFNKCLIYNLIQKHKGINQTSESQLQQLQKQTKMHVRLFPQPPQQRLITIKQGTEAETRIRGYTKFQLQTTAPVNILELALNAGLGLYNSQGMGCMEIAEKKPHFRYN